MSSFNELGGLLLIVGGAGLVVYRIFVPLRKISGAKNDIQLLDWIIRMAFILMGLHFFL